MANLDLDPAKTAVLAMDFQHGIVANQMAAGRHIVENAQGVLKAARKASILVVHVIIQFREGYPEVSPRNRMLSPIKQAGRFLVGHEETAIEKALGPEPGDLVVSRPRANAFWGSDLQTILRAREVDTLVMMGIATNWVVEATARYAADADYRVIVLEDCCAGSIPPPTSFL